MRALLLDFHPAAAHRRRLGEWLALAAAAVGAALLVGALARQRMAIEAQEARRDMLSARLRPARPQAEVVGPELSRRIVAANAVIDDLAVPWEALFDALQSVDARGLALLSLTPDSRQHGRRRAGAARSVPELLAYVDRLAALPMLAQVRLEGYSTVPRDGVEVVAFTLGTTWRMR
jgi:hypothetical protein